MYVSVSRYILRLLVVVFWSIVKLSNLIGAFKLENLKKSHLNRSFIFSNYKEKILKFYQFYQFYMNELLIKILTFISLSLSLSFLWLIVKIIFCQFQVLRKLVSIGYELHLNNLSLTLNYNFYYGNETSLKWEETHNNTKQQRKVDRFFKAASKIINIYIQRQNKRRANFYIKMNRFSHLFFLFC